MTFYVLREPTERAVDTLTCKVVETAWRRGLRVLIVGRDAGHCQLLDDLLWTFSRGQLHSARRRRRSRSAGAHRREHIGRP
ncbi:MAG: DNA polymerase III subunit chi [Gammaproteobacteria bacterium]|nr:DNA polymerase III subunit chi [Gammaproteobacteria bacterium]